MPLTPYGGDGGSDWLQSLLAAYGAGQPYGPGAAGVGLGGHMPTAGVVAGYSAAPTPGAPSMGYPAMGQNAGRPSVAPGMQAAAQVAPDYGPGSQRAALNQALNSTGSPQAYPPWPTPGVMWPPAGPAPAPTVGSGGGGIGSDARFPLTQQMPDYQLQQPDPRLLPWQGSSPAATVANAPPGNPSATPRTPTGAASQAPAGAPASNSRFALIDRPNMSAAGSGRSGAPQMTALNLAGLFGGGGQPVVNPNVPAANAQPVSAAAPVPGPLAQGGMSNAPWDQGPLQRKIGWPKKTPYGPDWRDKAAGHSGYQ